MLPQYRWSLTYNGSTYDISNIWWYKSNMHSVEAILQILNFDLFPSSRKKTSNLIFQASRTMRKKFLLFIGHPFLVFCYFSPKRLRHSLPSYFSPSTVVQSQSLSGDHLSKPVGHRAQHLRAWAWSQSHLLCELEMFSNIMSLSFFIHKMGIIIVLPNMLMRIELLYIKCLERA
jgi:hypothetical protein